MTFNGILQILLYFGILLLTVKPMGAFMAAVFTGQRTFLHPVLRPLEVGLYKLFGVPRGRGHEVDDLRGRHAPVQRRRPASHLRPAAPARIPPL